MAHSPQFFPASAAIGIASALLAVALVFGTPRAISHAIVEGHPGWSVHASHVAPSKKTSSPFLTYNIITRSGRWQSQVQPDMPVKLGSAQPHKAASWPCTANGAFILLATAFLSATSILTFRQRLGSQSMALLATSGEPVQGSQEKDMETEPNDGEEPKEFEVKKLTPGGLVQLILAGAGAPFLGELKEVAFDDPTKPDLTFELEANNFADKEGESLQTKNPYFTDGWVEEEEDLGPGFFQNLLSGGRLQREYEEKRQKKDSK